MTTPTSSFSPSFYTKMQAISTSDRFIISRMVQRALEDSANVAEPITKAESRFIKRYGTRETPPQTPATIGLWQKHGAGIYLVNQIIPAVFGRLEIPFALRGEGAYKISLSSHLVAGVEEKWGDALRDFASLIERTGRPEGCLVFGLGSYEDARGVYLPAAVGTTTDSHAAAGGSEMRLISVTLRWHDAPISGWVDPTRIQVECEWQAVDTGHHYYTCFGITDDGEGNVVDYNGTTLHNDGLVYLHAVVFMSVAEMLSGLLTKRIVYTKERKTSRRGGARRRGSKANVKTCLLDVALWNQYVRKPRLRLVSSSGQSSSSAPPASKYDGPSYTVGVINRGMWVLEKNVRPGEEWLDIKESKAGNMLVLVKRECNHEGYTVNGSGEPSLRLVQPVRKIG